MNSTVIIIHYGEIGLKGKNRGDFITQLKNNIRTTLSPVLEDFSVQKKPGYLTVVSKTPTDIDRAQNALQLTAGIQWFAFADQLPTQTSTQLTDELKAYVVDRASSEFIEQAAFAVRVKRSNKNLPLTSAEYEKEFGAAIIERTKWDRVNLNSPDITFHIDLHEDEVFIYTEKIKGPGGLPVGVAGKVLVLLSGGIDSPVASYLMAKRGCNVDFIHFTATPLQHKEAAEYKVSKLAEKLTKTTFHSKLFLVPYTHFNLALMDTNTNYEVVLFRRFMLRTAQKLAREHGYQGLVTGDNLSQVASQTLPNLVSAAKSVDLPIFQPLLGYDKTEIIELAKRIDTFELSCEPYKDCCALISDNPKTTSSHEKLEAIETKAIKDYEDLIHKTLDDSLISEFSI